MEARPAGERAYRPGLRCIQPLRTVLLKRPWAPFQHTPPLTSYNHAHDKAHGEIRSGARDRLGWHVHRLPRARRGPRPARRRQAAQARLRRDRHRRPLQARGAYRGQALPPKHSPGLRRGGGGVRGTRGLLHRHGVRARRRPQRPDGQEGSTLGRGSHAVERGRGGARHAHERGVIHRDIKPHNILLNENGRPKLTDFGVARALDASQATRTGSYLGTALYSPPEQLRGDGVTPKSDVYSLGVTLYHAATGQPPFIGAPIEIASQHVSREPIPPRELNDAVGESLNALILDCMNKDPDARPTADEVRLRLLEAGRGGFAPPALQKPAAEG